MRRYRTRALWSKRSLTSTPARQTRSVTTLRTRILLSHLIAILSRRIARLRKRCTQPSLVMTGREKWTTFTLLSILELLKRCRVCQTSCVLSEKDVIRYSYVQTHNSSLIMRSRGRDLARLAELARTDACPDNLRDAPAEWLLSLPFNEEFGPTALLRMIVSERPIPALASLSNEQPGGLSKCSASIAQRVKSEALAPRSSPAKR